MPAAKQCPCRAEACHTHTRYSLSARKLGETKEFCCQLQTEPCETVWTFRKEDRAAPPPQRYEIRSTHSHTHSGEIRFLCLTVSNMGESSSNRSDLRWIMCSEGYVFSWHTQTQRRWGKKRPQSVTFHSGGINKSRKRAFYGSQSFAICM